jgi:hypothetical protein
VVTTRKDRAIAHFRRGPHDYSLPQANDSGFPDRLRERATEATSVGLLNRTQDLVARVAGQLDFPINVMISPSFKKFLADVLDLGVEFNKLAPGVNFADMLPSWSHGSMSERLRKCGHNAFDERFRVIQNEHRFVNLLCDAGTVNNIKLVHSALSNPTRLAEVLPLEPYDNENWTAEDYHNFFLETVTDLYRRGTGDIEICGIICDNLPAQVSGLYSFLNIEDGPGSGIIHIPCLNHAANLVFAAAIQHSVLSEITNELPDRIRTLRSKEAVAILGNHCPGLVRTRWIYLVDVLQFILRHLAEAQSIFEIANKPPIPSHFGLAYLLLLPLWLFSRVMETRSCILGDVIPVAQEVLREWSEINGFFGDQEIVADCLNVLTANFLARLRRNAFDMILTAFAMTPRGRSHIRLAEYGFRTRGDVSAIPEGEFVLKMQHAFAHAMDVQQNKPFLDDEQRPAPPEFADELSQGGDVLNRIDEDCLDDAQLPFDSDVLGFKEVLEEEFAISLDERLNRNLADGILVRIREPIIRQALHLRYGPDQVLNLFDIWWTGADGEISFDVHADVYWREFHGRSDELARLAHVALRFVTLGCSEADIERLLSRQKQIQRQFGTNYRTDTLQARMILHRPR